MLKSEVVLKALFLTSEEATRDVLGAGELASCQGGRRS
jgi:hypothetical protein